MTILHRIVSDWIYYIQRETWFNFKTPEYQGLLDKIAADRDKVTAANNDIGRLNQENQKLIDEIKQRNEEQARIWNQTQYLINNTDGLIANRSNLSGGGSPGGGSGSDFLTVFAYTAASVAILATVAGLTYYGYIYYMHRRATKKYITTTSDRTPLLGSKATSGEFGNEEDKNENLKRRLVAQALDSHKYVQLNAAALHT